MARRKQSEPQLAAPAATTYTLDDLVARATRASPSMADRFAPFGEHPHALEHFPSGSLVPAP